MKLGTVSPFSAPLQRLLRDYLNEDLKLKGKEDEVEALVQSLNILREKKRLLEIQRALDKVKSADLRVKDSEMNCYVPVRVELTAKGNCSSNASICIPSKADLETPDPPPEEPAHPDTKEEERKKLHAKHQKEKSWGRKCWKARKDALAGYRADCVLNRLKPDGEKVKEMQKGLDESKAKREKENEEFNFKMKEMWLPDQKGVKDACSRQMMGFLSDGGYSYRIGKSVGVGFVPLVALADYVEVVRQKGQPLVLVREAELSQYRFAKMSVIV